jgi:tetratricopeptide (TPR) repeat protein
MFERGYFKEAERLIQIAEGACADSQSPIAAEIREALASVRGECNRIEESTDLLCKTLAIRERLLSPSDPLLAYSYKNVGLVFSCQGNFEGAFTCFEKAFSCIEKFHTPNPVAAASIFGNLGVYHMLKGDYDAAVSTLETALALNLEASAEGDDHYAE